MPKELAFPLGRWGCPVRHFVWSIPLAAILLVPLATTSLAVDQPSGSLTLHVTGKAFGGPDTLLVKLRAPLSIPIGILTPLVDASGRHTVGVSSVPLGRCNALPDQTTE